MGTWENARKLCYEEFKAFTVYGALAKNPLLPRKIREILEKLSVDEYRHYEFWRSVSGECASSVSRLKVSLYAILLGLFGITVVLKLLESRESEAQVDYREFLKSGEALAEKVIGIIKDEEEHEKLFVENIDEGRVKYLSSIALGVSDALVELTGIYTGSLGVFANTLSVGLVGLVAGVSASISMGIASYTQAKHAGISKPLVSALYTMLAYFVVALLLASPYFALPGVVLAFVAMIFIATLVVAYMSFYTSVLRGKRFTKELAENTALLLGIAFALYALGAAFRSLLNLPVE